MKFTRKEHIVTTLFDKEVSDENAIIIFKKLDEHRIFFSISLKKYLLNEDFTCVTHERVRIKKLDEENKTIDIIIFNPGGKTIQKDIKFSDIISVYVLTKKYKILDDIDDVSRFDLLDL